jgi:uncharacterized membrane protein YkvA (DUF1232 family)
MKTSGRATNPNLLSGVVPASDRGGEGAARIGLGKLDPQRVEQFNATLKRICPRANALVAGQIAAAARRLLFTGDDARERGAASIARRLARIEELEGMRADHGFALDADTVARIQTLVAYVEEGDDLIPDDTPVIGQLDDAILIDLLLRDLGPLLADYADYCAFRREIAAREGVPPEQVMVDCDDWIAVRRQEIEAMRDQRREGYAPTSAECGFRIG